MARVQGVAASVSRFRVKFPARFLRLVTRLLPLPGRIVRPWLRALDPWLSYPTPPVQVRVHGGHGRIEVRNFQEYIQRNLYFFGYYELRESRLVRALLRPGDTFIDAGANLGWFTLLASRAVGPTGRVVAFEPSRRIFDHLERHVALNALANVRLEPAALSDENGVATLSGISEQNAGLGSILPPAAGSPPGASAAETVKTVRLDDYLAEHDLGRIRLMKIDVEGAELKVLRGARKALEGMACDYVLVEVNDERLREIGSSSAEVRRLLEALNCKLYHVGLRRLTPLAPEERIRQANLLIEWPR